MQTLEQQMSFYAAYHQDARNKATHFVGVPMIIFGLFIALGWARVEALGVTLTAAMLLAAVVLVWYFLLDVPLALAMLVINAVLLYLADMVSALPLDQFLEPAGKRQILARLLRNLKGIYREADKPQRLLEVLNRMLTVAPEAHGELRERGLVYRRLECYRAALKDLSDYASLEPDAPDIEDVRAKVMELSALCARLN